MEWGCLAIGFHRFERNKDYSMPAGSDRPPHEEVGNGVAKRLERG
jgi:hypothetical protein